MRCQAAEVDMMYKTDAWTWANCCMGALRECQKAKFLECQATQGYPVSGRPTREPTAKWHPAPWLGNTWH